VSSTGFHDLISPSIFCWYCLPDLLIILYCCCLVTIVLSSSLFSLPLSTIRAGLYIYLFERLTFINTSEHQLNDLTTHHYQHNAIPHRHPNRSLWHICSPGWSNAQIRQHHFANLSHPVHWSGLQSSCQCSCALACTSPGHHHTLFLAYSGSTSRD
jgi:hypothetical protein